MTARCAGMDRPSSGRPDADVIVAGAGIAGLTACVLLARAGLRVVCIDPIPFPRERVGESLDWAVPALLDRIGLPAGRLIGDGIGTRKREVHGISTTGTVLIGRPPGWMSRWPLRFWLETVHIDRARFDCALYELANSAGVRFIWDRIVSVEVDADRVMGCSTQSGTLAATWFLDASGRARLFARAFGIDRLDGGPTRVAIWAHRNVAQSVEGTVLHLDDDSDPLRWAWEIPVSSHRQSVGVVLPEVEFRLRRAAGRGPKEILSETVAEFPGLSTKQPSQLDRVKVRAFRSYAHNKVSGSNWMMIGEAAAFVDPLTSAGVSSAMRHAAEAADIIRLVTQRPRRLRCDDSIGVSVPSRTSTTTRSKNCSTRRCSGGHSGSAGQHRPT